MVLGVDESAGMAATCTKPRIKVLPVAEALQVSYIGCLTGRESVCVLRYSLELTGVS